MGPDMDTGIYHYRVHWIRKWQIAYKVQIKTENGIEHRAQIMKSSINFKFIDENPQDSSLEWGTDILRIW